MKLVPVYQFYADNPWRCMYSTKNEKKEGWVNSGIAFYAYSERVAESAAVYANYADKPLRFNYSNYPENTNGWTAGEVAFYAPNQSGYGLQPFYLYYAEQPWRTIISSNSNEGNGWTRGDILFWALPGNLEIQSHLRQIDYKDADKFSPKQEFIDSGLVNNLGSATVVTRELAMSRSYTSSFEWGLSIKLAIGIENTLEVGIPDLGDLKSTQTFNLEFGSDFKSTKTETKTYTFKDTVQIPAGDRVQITGLVNWMDNVKVPFDLTLEYSAKTGSNLTGSQIRDILAYSSPDLKIIAVQDHSVLAVAHGTFTGSYGLHSCLEVKPY